MEKVIDKICINCRYWTKSHKFSYSYGMRIESFEIYETGECRILHELLEVEAERDNSTYLGKPLAVETPCSFGCILWEERK